MCPEFWVHIKITIFESLPLVMFLDSALKRMDEMPQRTFEEIVEKYVEMNISHPFREGNDRAIRLWLDYILKNQIQKVVDWNKIDKEDYLLAMQRSPIRDIEIKHVLRDALISEIYDREIYMKGLDASYYYEGYIVYNSKDLFKRRIKKVRRNFSANFLSIY